MSINDLVLKVNDVLTGSVLIRLVPVISPELQLQLQSVVREQSSGCGSVHSSECQRSSQKQLWLRSSSRSVMMEP